MNVADHSTPAVLVLQAMVKVSSAEGTIAPTIFSYGDGKGNFDVKMTVNGIEVDIIDTLNQSWIKLCADNDQKVMERAYEMYQQRIDRANEIMRDSFDQAASKAKDAFIGWDKL